MAKIERTAKYCMMLIQNVKKIQCDSSNTASLFIGKKGNTAVINMHKLAKCVTVNIHKLAKIHTFTLQNFLSVFAIEKTV